MKVKELIEELKKQDPEKRVCLYHRESEEHGLEDEFDFWIENKEDEDTIIYDAGMHPFEYIEDNEILTISG